MRVFLFAFALSSVAILSILAKPVFNDEDSEEGNIMFQLDSDFNGLEKENSEINEENTFSIRTNYNRRKREVQVMDDTNKSNTQKGIPIFNETPNIQNEKSDLDLIQNNKLSSSGNTNQLSQTGFPTFQGIPNFSGIQNIPKIPNIPNILNSENKQSGSSASLNFPNILSNLPTVPQFQSRIDVPMNSNLQNVIPNFYGNQNQQSGIPNLLNGIPNLQNGIQNLQNGIPNLQSGISDLQNRLSNYFNPNSQFGIPQFSVNSNNQNGLPNFSLDSNSPSGFPKFTVNGLPNLSFGLDPQKGMQNFNLSELEAMYNKFKTKAENNKNNNMLQEMLKNFDRFMKGVRDFFGNMTGGLTTRVTDDINKFFLNGFPFGNRN